MFNGLRDRHQATSRPTATAPLVAPTPTRSTRPAAPSPTRSSARVPHTRTGAAWFALCTAALLFVVLIVFMLQNTASVEVSFLWMHGNLPLALALLIAGVGAAILTMVVGAARITQLRRQSRRNAV